MPSARNLGARPGHDTRDGRRNEILAGDWSGIFNSFSHWLKLTFCSSLTGFGHKDNMG